MKAVIITGSRHWHNSRAAISAVQAACSDARIIIHGDCNSGIDAIAERLTHSGEALPMPAQWGRHGRAAGPRRNAQMVIVAEALRECGWSVECHAFPGPSSKGTWDMVRKCKAAGIATTVHRLENKRSESA